MTGRRRLTGLAVLVLLLGIGAVLSVGIGARPTSPAEVWHALFGATATPADEIVRQLRVPRTVLGVVAGAALGVAGAVIQGHTRNPLADPGLLGINAGAALLVVVAIGPLGWTDPGSYIWSALLGALLAGLVVFAVGSTTTTTTTAAGPLNLALTGLAVTFLLQAVTSAIVLGDTATMDLYRFWVVGSVAGRDLEVVGQVAPFLLVGFVLAAAGAPALNLLGLGTDVARSLGARVGLQRLGGLAAVTLLAGAATAACGPIAFLGLIVPHLARTVTGPDYRWLIPASALLGAVLLLGADVLGRIAARPGELQVGIVLAVLGGAFFVAVVRRRVPVAL